MFQKSYLAKHHFWYFFFHFWYQFWYFFPLYCQFVAAIYFFITLLNLSEIVKAQVKFIVPEVVASLSNCQYDPICREFQSSDSTWPYILEQSVYSRSQMFFRTGVLKSFAKLVGTHLCQSLFFNKVTGLTAATLLKKRLWDRCSPVNFAKILRTLFLEHLRWLFLCNSTEFE